MLSADAFADLVAETGRQHNIPGLNAALIRGDEVRSASWGVLNIETQVDVTADSVFQIGSITKVFTGTLIMQLADEGLVELDAPVGRYLPELQIDGAPVSDAITIRQLLAHNSGIIGDLFCDTGRNDDATALYIERCRELRYFTKPGEYFSYCNSGFNMLGRVIEVVTGKTWGERLRTALLEPLAIKAAVDAEETPRFRAAIGHVLDDDGKIVVTPTPFLPRGAEAAGARLAMSPGALLAFARMHLQDGVAPDGTRLLQAQTAHAMRELQAPLPVDIAGPNGYGLSWQVYNDWEPRAVGHDGNTVGQSAFLRVFPAWNVAISLLTNVNSGGPPKAFDQILRAVLASIGDASIPQKPEPNPAVTVESARLVGTYETYLSRIVVTEVDGMLCASVSQRNSETLGKLPDHHLVLTPVGDDRFIAEDQTYGSTNVVGFTGSNGNGKARFLFTGFRLAERVAD